MAVPQDKKQLLEAVQATYQKLAIDLASVPSARTRERSLEGHVKGTHRSVADLVAYLIGWNLLVLKWCAARQEGREVDFPETGFRWNELGQLAQSFYAARATLDYPELLRQLAEVHARLVAHIQHESDAALYGAPWYKKYTQGRMIQLNASSPYANARARLRAWKRAQRLS